MESTAQGKLVAYNVFARKLQAFDDRIIPWVTFTDPELARVGMTEADLQKSKIKYRVRRVDFKKLDCAGSIRDALRPDGYDDG